MSNFYIVDIIATTGCNLRCKYCYEGETTHTTKKLSPEVISNIYDRIDELLVSDFILDNFGGISIQLFGGEPTTNPEFINEILHRYKTNPRVEFLIFTNGYKLDPILETLEEIKDNKYRTFANRTKCMTQISYDGKTLQDINRRTACDKPSSKEVRSAIELVIDKKIPFAIKSTVTESTLQYLPESYDEILEIAELANRAEYSSYFPTLDYTIHERNVERDLPVLEEALMQIAKREIKHFNKYGKFFFRWFDGGKAMCSAGFAMSVINFDGNVYPCHGCIYGDNLDSHLITNVENKTDFVNIIKDSSSKFEKIYRNIPEKCKNCDSTFCLKCNATKFEVSEKDDYFEKWTDHCNQPEMCEYYMKITEVKRAMEPFLRR